MKLLYLFLILISLLRAEEIGMPFSSISSRIKFSDAVLAKDGMTLYTITAKTKFSKWSLRPFKMSELNEIENGVYAKLLITNDPSKIVLIKKLKDRSFAPLSSLHIWDTNAKRIVFSRQIKKDPKEEHGTLSSFIVNAVINKNSIVFIDIHSNVELWDINTAKMIRSSKLPANNYECTHADYPLFIMITKDENTLVAVNDETIHFFDSTTLEQRKKITHIPNIKAYYIGNDPYKLYYRSATGDYKIDINTGITEPIADNWIYEHAAILNKFDLEIFDRSIPKISDKLVMQVEKDVLVFYNKATDNKIAELYSYDKNEWILMTPDGYFDGSPESRKYLYMKTPSGESVPINDATYKKYHKPIYLNDVTKDK